MAKKKAAKKTTKKTARSKKKPPKRSQVKKVPANKIPPAIHRFPYTLRIQAYEMALDRGLHLIRDNFHMWAIRLSDKRHVHLCHVTSYDSLWRAVCNFFREPDFNADNLPYMVAENEKQIQLYDPVKQETFFIDKKDLRTGEKEE